MSISIDHVGIPAADPEASARFLRGVLGEGDTAPEGPSGEMINLNVGHCALTYFQLPDHEPHHIAFRVTQPVLAGAVARLRERGIPFGNDPEDASNGQTADPLGALGRGLLPRSRRPSVRAVRSGRFLTARQWALGPKEQPSGSNLVACVFEYLHARWAMAGLVGVSETVRAGARLAARGYQRVLGCLRMRK